MCSTWIHQSLMQQGVGNLPKVFTQWRSERESNLLLQNTSQLPYHYQLRYHAMCTCTVHVHVALQKCWLYRYSRGVLQNLHPICLFTLRVCTELITITRYDDSWKNKICKFKLWYYWLVIIISTSRKGDKFHYSENGSIRLHYLFLENYTFSVWNMIMLLDHGWGKVSQFFSDSDILVSFHHSY